jgi:hypothetical protein
VSINDRTLIQPLELDVVIPSKRIAIEINGLYYHGERAGKDRDYHVTKTDLVEKQGYQLLHYTDFDVEHRWSVVELSLKAKLGLLSKLDARKLQLRSVSRDEASEFLNRTHLQGSSRFSWAYGLYNGDELVAVATFARSRYDRKADFELIRFASTYTVRGGAGRLLTAFFKDHPGTLVTYADRRWSRGDLYQTLGFSREGTIKPGYWYFNSTGIYHRSLFQKKKIANEHCSHLTEWQIMKNSGWDRYWDCGHIKFVMRKEAENV